MKTEFKYFSDISDEDFEINVVLPFINEEGRPCVLIRNAVEKCVLVSGSTDNLEYRFNTTVNKDGKNYYFHIISCLKDDGYSKEQFFIGYNYLFKEIEEPKTDFDLGSLINSLEQLFKVTPEQDRYKLHIGVFGELLFLDDMLKMGCSDIISTYHSNFFSKHDLELDRYNRIEIKTTLGPDRIHHFSHDQICRTDINVYVASCILEESKEGVSLNELFESVMERTNNPSALLWLGQLKGFCGISEENAGPSFSYEKAINDIKVFKANDLPHLDEINKPGVTNISYDVDCNLSEELDLSSFVRTINIVIEDNNK